MGANSVIRSSSRTVFHVKPLGSKRWTIGLYAWGRQSATRFSYAEIYKRGLVLRAGPLGHVQGQVYRVRVTKDGRVPRATAMISWWGVSGRRRKRYVEVSVGSSRFR